MSTHIHTEARTHNFKKYGQSQVGCEDFWLLTYRLILLFTVECWTFSPSLIYLLPVGWGGVGEEKKQDNSCPRWSMNTGSQMEKDYLAKRVTAFAPIEERNSLFACGQQLKGVTDRQGPVAPGSNVHRKMNLEGCTNRAGCCIFWLNIYYCHKKSLQTMDDGPRSSLTCFFFSHIHNILIAWICMLPILAPLRILLLDSSSSKPQHCINRPQPLSQNLLCILASFFCFFWLSVTDMYSFVHLCYFLYPLTLQMERKKIFWSRKNEERRRVNGLM